MRSLHVPALLGLHALVGCGSISTEPVDGGPSNEATGGSTTDGDPSATGGAAPGSGGGGSATEAAQVGSCHFEDAGLAAAVRAALPYGNEDNVLEVSTLSIGEGVRSLDGIGCLTGLNDVFLFGAQLEHALDLAPLGDVTNLTFLHLLGGQYENLEVVPTLPVGYLQLAELDWTSLDVLAGAQTVEVMWLVDMATTDVGALSTLSSLRSLSLENCQTADLSPLASLDSLEELWISNAPVEELPGFGQIDSLHLVSLYGTALASLEGLAGAPALAQLYVDPAPELDNLSGLEGLPSLLRLTIGGSALSDLSVLSTIPTLETVELTRAQIEDISPLASFENLGTLRLSDNQIVDLEPISGMGVGTLDVSNNPLGSLEPISTMLGLDWLAMQNVGATSLDFLAGHELVLLDASRNDIEDVSVLAGMPLTSLDLSENAIATLPDDFVGATGGCSDTRLELNPLDVPATELLETLCSTYENSNYFWDGGYCTNCILLK